MISEKILELKSWKNSFNEMELDYISKVLEKLPDDSRIVIFLHYWRDIEFEDIADALCIPQKEVEFIHNVTLRLLSKVFRQKFIKQKSMEAT